MKRRYNPLFSHEINNIWYHSRSNADNGEDVIQALERKLKYSKKFRYFFVIFYIALIYFLLS